MFKSAAAVVELGLSAGARGLRCLAFAAFLLSAAASRADVIHVLPMRPAAPSADQIQQPAIQTAGTAPGCYTSQGSAIPCTLDIQYFGGAVLSNIKVYAVFWNSEVPSDISGGIGGFYQTLTNSERVDWLTEYSTTITVQAGSHTGQAGTQQVIGRGTFAGNYTLPVLSTTYPPCTSPSTLTCVSDSDVQSEIAWQVLHGNLPVPDANTLYAVHFPPSVRIELGSSASCEQFCAYHGSFNATFQSVVQPVFYAVLPDLGSNGCQNGCGQFSTFQNTCMVASHEVTEAITDSLVGLASTVDYPLGWYDNESQSQGEICDMCLQHADTIGQNGVPGCSTSAAGCYTVQQCFSHVVWNADPSGQPNVPACVTTRFDADDYSIALSPNALTLVPGATAPPIPVVTTLTNGSPQSLTLSVTELPAGLHASFDNPSPSVGQAANLTVSADANATLFQAGVLVVQATGAATHSASLLVQLVAPPNNWSLSISPTGGVLLPGAGQVYMVSGQVTFGNPEVVSLASTVAGLPTGVTASFGASTLTPGGSPVVLTLTAASNAPAAAPATFTVTGNSASQPGGHTATAQVQVDTLPTVAFTAPSAGATVAGVVVVQVAATPGANTSLASVTVAVDGTTLSSGLAASTSWDTHTVPDGPHVVTVTALDVDRGSASASLNVTVANNDFALAISPSSVALADGKSVILSVATTVASGNAELVNLVVTGLPPGVQGTLAPQQLTAGSTSTLTLVAQPGAAAAPPTPFAVVGTSSSQPGGHTAMAQLQVDTLPTVAFTAPAAGATVAGVVVVQVTASPGTNTSLASISIAVDGATLSSGQATSTSWDTRTVSNGTRVLTVTAVDVDGASASASLSVTVANVVNNFALALSPSSVALSDGESANLTVTTSVTSGNAELVGFAVTGLPAGVQGTFAVPQVTAGANGTLTLRAQPGTAVTPATPFTVTATSASQPGGHTARATVSVSAATGGGCSSTGETGGTTWLLGFIAAALFRLHLAGRIKRPH